MIGESIGVFEDAFDGPWCDEAIRRCTAKIENVLSEHGDEKDLGKDGVWIRNNDKRKDYSLDMLRYTSLDHLNSGLTDVLTRRSDEYFQHFSQDASHQETYRRTDEKHWVHKFQWTPPGGGFSQWHYEQGGGIVECATRYAVWMVYLNDVLEENGGATDFPVQGVSIQPKRGTLVVWPAGYTHPHRSAPDLKQHKYILTGWMVYGIDESET